MNFILQSLLVSCLLSSTLFNANTKLAVSAEDLDEDLKEHYASPNAGADRLKSLMANPKFIELFKSDEMQKYYKMFMEDSEGVEFREKMMADPGAEEFLEAVKNIMREHAEL